ncbi:MAG: hypothetical protein EZS28_046416 [Streblomastix strix]|uniref:Uncharacterized protein n=1 Tax=Streblomastix strix TaxID=222440 RepID=A0A5J4TIG5_9EUKA|nr:MAG: hypothetical protein EZS28_046416 [Streblomastix strix]
MRAYLALFFQLLSGSYNVDINYIITVDFITSSVISRAWNKNPKHSAAILCVYYFKSSLFNNLNILLIPLDWKITLKCGC